jgi:DNA-binding transcriptional LysR family regulator
MISARRYLPDILAHFSASYPTIAVEISRAASCELAPKLRAGELDLMLCEGGHEPPQWPAVEIWRAPLEWIVSEAHPHHLDNPLPLSLSPGNCPLLPTWLDECIWRGAALRALQRERRRYKNVATSSSMAGQLVAVSAGLAISVANHSGLTRRSATGEARRRIARTARGAAVADQGARSAPAADRRAGRPYCRDLRRQGARRSVTMMCSSVSRHASLSGLGGARVCNHIAHLRGGWGQTGHQGRRDQAPTS